VYLGVNGVFFEDFNIEKKFWDRPYILFVGQRAGYKNFEFLMKALSRVSKFGKDFGLICFGGGNFTNSEKALFNELSLSIKDIRHESGSDQKLKVAYSQALALVYPSLYEGFGLPIVEAMASRCLVITSDSISIAEAGGEEAIYFESKSAESLISLLNETLALDSKSQKTKRESGFNWASKFTWNATASQTIKVYLEI
jgi:glycosyltransferase involved in cell wall biosynthesis